jgi:hypothetical protein
VRGPKALPWALAIAVGLLGDVPPVVAQSWSVETELTIASRYEWRGLVREPGANLQQALYLSAFPGDAIVTAGAWAFTDLSRDANGSSAGWFSELSPWIEASYGSDRAFAFLGVTAYHVEEGAFVPPWHSTLEAYAGAEGMLPRVPLHVEGTLFWDLQTVRGGYLDAATSLQVPLWTGLLAPVGSLFLESRVGTWLDRGMGHVDVSLYTTSTPVRFWGLEGSVTLESRWTRGLDPETRRSLAGGVDRDRWAWRAGVHLNAPACRPERQLCEDL